MMNLKSWKTTTIGVLVLVVWAYDVYTNGFNSQWVDGIIKLGVAFGFLFSKDGDKTNSRNPVGTKSNTSARVSNIRKDDYTDIGGDGPSEGSRD